MVCVACMTCELGAEGVAFIRGAGGGSSGLSSCGAAIGGAWGPASRGGMWAHLCFSSSSCAVAEKPLRMGKAGSVPMMSKVSEHTPVEGVHVMVTMLLASLKLPAMMGLLLVLLLSLWLMMESALVV